MINLGEMIKTIFSTPILSLEAGIFIGMGIGCLVTLLVIQQQSQNR